MIYAFYISVVACMIGQAMIIHRTDMRLPGKISSTLVIWALGAILFLGDGPVRAPTEFSIQCYRISGIHSKTYKKMSADSKEECIQKGGQVRPRGWKRPDL